MPVTMQVVEARRCSSSPPASCKCSKGRYDGTRHVLSGQDRLSSRLMQPLRSRCATASVLGSAVYGSGEVIGASLATNARMGRRTTQSRQASKHTGRAPGRPPGCCCPAPRRQAHHSSNPLQAPQCCLRTEQAALGTCAAFTAAPCLPSCWAAATLAPCPLFPPNHLQNRKQEGGGIIVSCGVVQPAHAGF